MKHFRHAPLRCRSIITGQRTRTQQASPAMSIIEQLSAGQDGGCVRANVQCNSVDAHARITCRQPPLTALLSRRRQTDGRCWWMWRACADNSLRGPRSPPSSSPLLKAGVQEDLRKGLQLAMQNAPPPARGREHGALLLDDSSLSYSQQQGSFRRGLRGTDRVEHVHTAARAQRGHLAFRWISCACWQGMTALLTTQLHWLRAYRLGAAAFRI